MNIDLAAVASDLKKPLEKVEAALKLLDEGNSIPFITRFRKDQTGGMNEELLQKLRELVTRLRALAERRAFVTRSIESQGKLTEDLAAAIAGAKTGREIEDLYLPFKPKKQSLAAIARRNGLEPLAKDIDEGREPERDLATRATDFVRVDLDLNSVDEVIAGVGHILAERFSDNVGLRNELRELIAKSGTLKTTLIPLPAAEENAAETAEIPEPSAEDSKAAPTSNADSIESTDANSEEKTADAAETTAGSNKSVSDSDQPTGNPAQSEAPEGGNAFKNGDSQDETTDTASPTVDAPASIASPETAPTGPGDHQSRNLSAAADANADPKKPAEKKRKKKKKRAKVDDPWREYDGFSCAISKIPYHRALAINRAEKAGRVKVKIEFDDAEFRKQAAERLVANDHPFAEFLRSCVNDAITRLMIPGVVRELRRETTESAEQHAVNVFARNLKQLLLQAPVENSCVMAIDPGYKRGCSVAVLDHQGNPLDHGHIYVVGNEQRRVQSRKRLGELARKHNVDLIAIGNGAACRETEQLVSDTIGQNPDCSNVRYAIVNEAGTNDYSTSEVGREELPDENPAARSAVSIGRRLINPLSELVKISPANIGVGMYQHDIKARHLADSLEEVVAICVNRVGVDVNSASPSLLGYVSGLNLLTARRVYEFRQEHGPFKNLQQLKQVTGFGDATWQQATGFLRIRDGEEPLDATSVHPECYSVARELIKRAGANEQVLFGADCAAKFESSSTAQDAEHVEQPSPQAEGDAANPTAADLESKGTSADSQAPSAESAESVEPAKPAHAPQPENPERKKQIDSLRNLDLQQLSRELDVGEMTLRDIVYAISRPDYDPRHRSTRPVFRSGIVKIDDLKPGMRLDAQVVNVVDFGVFVDIGIGTSCLVHVSKLAHHFIRDPHRHYSIGDVLKVWVAEVDLQKRRVALVGVDPSTPAPERTRKPGPRKQGRGEGKKRGSGSSSHSGRSANRRPAKQPRKRSRPVKPITDEMLTGSEPMRSFSDLAQFFDKKPEAQDKGK